MEVVRLNLDIPIKYTAQLKKYILEKSPYFDSIRNYLIQNIIDDLFLHKNNELSIGEIEDCFDAYLKCLSKEK